MNKFVSVIMLAALLIITCLPIASFAKSVEEERHFIYLDEEFVEYYADDVGTYILKSGKKEYITVVDSFVLVTDPNMLRSLKSEVQMDKISNLLNHPVNAITNKSSNIVYSGKLDFSSTIAITPAINISGYNYYYLKCSNLNPSGAKRGFSYYAMVTIDNGASWYQYESPFVNYSLSQYTRFSRARLGNPQYISFKMWSYYGTVDSCTLSVKLADS